jgi:oligopeptide/dipeptide ABC transporter ATP-binding protein
MDGLPPHLAHLPKGCSFEPRCRYAIERCREEKPELTELGGNHRSACHRYADIIDLAKKDREG